MIQKLTTQKLGREFPNVVIRASAGTGKTYQLSNRYIGLAVAGASPEQILAVTFARKAAGEILDRVLLRLAEGALDAKKAAELAHALDDSHFDRAGAMAQLCQLTRQLHRLRIGTLDGFFVKMATHFSLELGMPPGWRIVDDLEDARLQSEAIRAVLARKSTTDMVALLQLLSKGDVKRSVTSQIGDAVENLYTLYRETKSEAWHALNRRKKLEPEQLAAAIIGVANVPVGDAKRWTDARDADFGRATSEDWIEFLAKGLAAKIHSGENAYYKKPIDPHIIETYRPLVDHACAVLVNQAADVTEATWKLLDDFHAEYERLKLVSGTWRFDDITRKLADALEQGHIPSAAYRLDAPIVHLLLDEFQDTSLAQWDVVRRFAEEVTNGGAGSFLCVGDVKQAIYGWRGGLSEIFDSVVTHLPGLAQTSLKHSFRSSPKVIDTVNQVFAGIAKNRAIIDGGFTPVGDTWCAGYETHTTAKGHLRGHCRLVAAPRSETDQRIATLAFAADEVRRLAQRYSTRTLGVLVRKNATVARLIYLLRNHPDHPIAASEEGGNPLTDSVAVQLLLSLLTIVDHPGNKPARYHVATSPLASLVGLTDHTDDALARRVANRIRQELSSAGYAPTIERWVEHLAPHCDGREMSRLAQLVEMAYAYDEQSTTRTSDFIAHVGETRVEDPTAAQVRVMTVHQAKGLQFDVVVLPELDVSLKPQVPQVVIDRDEPGGPVTRVCRYVSREVQELLPPKFQKMFEHWPQQAVNESLCLLYVAMTRPVHALHMIISPSKENENAFPKTYAGILRSALVEPSHTIEPGSVLYEHGDVRWDDAKEGPPAAPPREVVLGEIRLSAKGGSTLQRRGFDHRTPSGMEGGPTVDLKRRLRLDTSDAMRRGSLLHKWFECIEWLDDGPPTDAALIAAAAALEWRPDDLAAELAHFRQLLDREAIRKLLSRPSDKDSKRCEVQRERSFVLADGETILRGSIDRLVLSWRGSELAAADVIDFKTDRLANDDQAVDDAVEFYRPQLEAYRKAASVLTGLDASRVGARIAFVESAVVRKI